MWRKLRISSLEYLKFKEKWNKDGIIEIKGTLYAITKSHSLQECRELFTQLKSLILYKNVESFLHNYKVSFFTRMTRALYAITKSHSLQEWRELFTQLQSLILYKNDESSLRNYKVSFFTRMSRAEFLFLMLFSWQFKLMSYYSKVFTEVSERYLFNPESCMPIGVFHIKRVFW